MLIIGIDPGSKKEGVGVLLGGKLVSWSLVEDAGAHTAYMILLTAKSTFAAEGNGDGVAIVAIEEWTMSANAEFTATNFAAIRSLERAGQRWATCAELLGFRVVRINSVSWQKAQGISPKKKGSLAPTTKAQAKRLVQILFNVDLPTADVADAILIAKHADALVRACAL